jgi:PTH1 family peptidyl-tRNA hydrolase
VKLVVGLGNPDPEYRATRHNVGWLVVEEVRRRHGAPSEERRARSFVCRVPIVPGGLVLARPQTYMNRSGAAVAALAEWAGAAPAEILVICDDLYLAVGTLRLRSRGGHGGHNGLRSIIETLGTEAFPRLRVGVGPAEPGTSYADFVLAPFPRDDRERLGEVVARAADCAESAASEGLHAAMNRFNRRPADAGGDTGDDPS